MFWSSHCNLDRAICNTYCSVYRSRQENEDLKADYQHLQASYEELERIKNSLQENGDINYTNLTDAQTELELSNSRASCKYLVCFDL